MNIDMIKALEDLEKEKGIKKDYMLDRISKALAAAFKAHRKASVQSTAIDNLFVDIDSTTGAISMHAVMTVVEPGLVDNAASEIDLEDAVEYSPNIQVGDQLKIEVEVADFSRIAAQTAMQVIKQGIREAERGMVVEEFASKEHDILTATVSKVDSHRAIIEINGKRDKTETSLSASEQIRG